ncbi:MAG: CFI-box-CTERM domain-containing protein [Candidatus Nitrosoabyssus spongiisocia]|nr:MAG: CFI-box-CTERM domain-containing protein [Nitrosopumilaceae archaeon AB1(1)]
MELRLSQQVQMLREIRDTTLMTSLPGISFITSFNQIYYTFSPVIADAERENPLLREIIQTILYPLLSSVSIMTMVDDSENSVLALGLLVIAINLLIYVGLPTLAFVYLHKKIKSVKLVS